MYGNKIREKSSQLNSLGVCVTEQGGRKEGKEERKGKEGWRRKGERKKGGKTY